MPSSVTVSPEPAISSHRAWLIVAILTVTLVINYVDRQVAFSIFPALRQDLGFNNQQLALIGTLFIFVYSGCSPIVGRLADIFRRERLVVISLLLWSLCTLATGMAGSVNAFLFWRAMMGVTEALYMPAALSIVAVVHTGSTRSTALAVHACGQMAGIVVGGWFGGWAADHWGWRTGFVVLAAIGIGFAPILRLVLGRIPEPASHGKVASTPAEVLSSRCIRALAIAFFMLCGMLWMFYAWLPAYIFDKFRLSMTESGLVATLYLQAATTTGILLGGALADRIVKQTPAGRFYIGGAGLIVSAPFAYWTFAAGSVDALKIAAVGFGLFAGIMIANVFAASYDVISQRNYGFATGGLNLIGGVAGGIGIFLAGAWKDSIGLHGLIGWTAIGAAVAAAAMIVVASRSFAADRERAGMRMVVD
ncbi:MAG: MFS transporter [Bryobacteraceae bacterium]